MKYTVNSIILDRMHSVFDKAVSGFEGFGNDFTKSVDSFASSVGSFAQAAKSIPNTIAMSGKHDVQVTLNGAAVLQQLEPGLKKLVEGAISDQLSKIRGLDPNSSCASIS